jgi:D-3-phosphoglycerate dehydrogenase / 2-oxoglutarate reductase
VKVVVPDDYQGAVATLACFDQLAGHDVTTYRDTAKDVDALVERFRSADALVLIRERTRITRELLERLPALRLIAQTGRGIPHIDLAACTELGVAVSVGGGSPVAPAELTWGLILAVAKHIPREAEAVRRGEWQTTLGWDLDGKTLGIYGYGSIGALVAGYGRAFGMRVLVTGREGSRTRAETAGFETAAREVVFRESDVVSLHLKLNEETKGIVTSADLASMKPSAVLVNTSRSGLIAPGALVDALQGGRPGFAAVDVFDEEPVPAGDALAALENAVCTPHLGYVTRESYELFFSQAFDQVNGFAAGTPIGVVNPEALGRS